MARYKRKPITVQAVKWDGTNVADVVDLLGKQRIAGLVQRVSWEPASQVLRLELTDGLVRSLVIGQYVVVDPRAGVAVVGPDAFEADHEPV